MQGDAQLATAEALGLDPARLEELTARARREVDEGLLPSTQLAIARHGRLALFETYGGASNDTLYCVYSATKTITSAAAWLLLQEGRLDTQATVASLIPEFATNGKDVVTVEQLFTHTAGFPHAPFRATDWPDKQARYARFQKWRLTFPPGSRFEYHATSSMWVIAELVERLSSQPFETFVRERIALPLGLPDLRVGAPDEIHPRIAEVSLAGEPLAPEDFAKAGLPVPPITEVTPEAMLAFNDPATRRVPIPGGGGYMSAADLALFYQALLGQLPKAAPLWSAETMQRVTTPLTGDLKDATTGAACHRALGVIIAGDKRRNFRGFGHTNSPNAFGHGGAGGQIAWADPATGISFAYCTNAHDQNPIRQGRRGTALSSLAANCTA